MRKADGTWWFDYTVFDMWVEFMMSLGVDGQINCYSMVPWKLSFQYFDQASNSFRFLDASPGDREYEEFWTRMLRSFAGHLREKGWFDITMIAMDERPMEDMLAAVAVIKNADPDFRIAFEGNCHEELLDVLDYYCIPVWDSYPDGSVAKRRAEGKVTTYYTIRFERLKAGITAYRKIMALREEFIRTGNKAGMARLEKALSLFVLPDADALRRHVIDRDMPDTASDAVNAAKKILDRL